MDKKRIVVLGSTGMLGWTVYEWLKKNHDVIAPAFRVENPAPEKLKNFDYIVNCIGLIKARCSSKEQATLVNAQFPWWLAKNVPASTRIIHIVTDAVFSGTEGSYIESDPHQPSDVYSETKSQGEVHGHSNFLNIRCSIVGHELKTKNSLLEWFLAQPQRSRVQGFTHHRWNGVTTLQFAQLCNRIIEQNAFEKLRKTSDTHHFVPTEELTKAKVLEIFKTVYKKDITVEPNSSMGPALNFTLATKFHDLEKLFPRQDFSQAVEELHQFVISTGQRASS